MSGDIVNFGGRNNTKIESLKIGIDPVQDLHGYDSPWPAGGGKNLAPFEDVLPDGFTKTERGVTVTVSNGVVHLRGVSESTTTWNILDYQSVWRSDSYYIPAGTYSIATRLTMRIGHDNRGGTFTIDEESQVKGFYIFVSAGDYGKEVSYDIPLAFVSGSTIPTVWTPYSNICPITGWSDVNVWRTGKNLLDVDKYGQPLPRTQNGITWSKVRDGVYHASGTATGNSYFNLSFYSDAQSAMPCISFRG